jgi:type VI secretion system protein ImpM
MPDTPTARRSVSGFFGKSPARADFIAGVLPRSCTDAWEAWVAVAVAGSRATMPDTWVETWLEAPVWRFALPAGLCGQDPLLGLWLPSVDKVGRYFPLMLAATCPGATPEQMARHGTGWLAAAEDAGRAAIADDLDPEQLAGRIPPPPDPSSTPDNGLPQDLQPRPGAALWWTEGAPRVPAHGLVLDAMPDVATFPGMLDAGHARR